MAKRYDKNTPQVGDLLIAGKEKIIYINIGTIDDCDLFPEQLPAFVIRCEKNNVYLRFPSTGHTLTESKRRLRFKIKRRDFILKKAKRNDK